MGPKTLGAKIQYSNYITEKGSIPEERAGWGVGLKEMLRNEVD